MSKFQLAFDTDNAAFEEGGNAEIVRILRDVADRIERSDSLDAHHYGGIRDVNGNTVGSFAHEED